MSYCRNVGDVGGTDCDLCGGIVGSARGDGTCYKSYSDCNIVYDSKSERGWSHLGIGRIAEDFKNVTDCFVLNTRMVNGASSYQDDYGGIIGVDNYDELIKGLGDGYKVSGVGAPLLSWEE